MVEIVKLNAQYKKIKGDVFVNISRLAEALRPGEAWSYEGMKEFLDEADKKEEKENNSKVK